MPNWHFPLYNYIHGKIHILKILISPINKSMSNCTIKIVYVKNASLFGFFKHKKAAPRSGLPCSVKRSSLAKWDAWPSVPRSSPRPRTATTLPGSGPAAAALGIGLPFRASRCAEASTLRVSSVPSCRSAVLDVTFGFSFESEHPDAPASAPYRAQWAVPNLMRVGGSRKIHMAEHSGTFSFLALRARMWRGLRSANFVHAMMNLRL
jgi:hypothetical protein